MLLRAFILRTNRDFFFGLYDGSLTDKSFGSLLHYFDAECSRGVGFVGVAFHWDIPLGFKRPVNPTVVFVPEEEKRRKINIKPNIRGPNFFFQTTTR